MSCVLSCFSCVRLCVTLWTVAYQAPLNTGFSRQEYWSGLPWPPPGDLPDSWIEPMSLTSPALAGGLPFVAQLVKNPPAMWETRIRSLDWEDLLEKTKATHCSILG